MNWETIKRHRTAQTVVGKCTVSCIYFDVYRLSLNRKELLTYNADSWEQATQRAECHLLRLANWNAPMWTKKWTALTPLGPLAIKLWENGFKLSLDNKIISEMDCRYLGQPPSLENLACHAEREFLNLTEKLITELS